MRISGLWYVDVHKGEAHVDACGQGEGVKTPNILWMS